MQHPTSDKALDQWRSASNSATILFASTTSNDAIVFRYVNNSPDDAPEYRRQNGLLARF